MSEAQGWKRNAAARLFLGPVARSLFAFGILPNLVFLAIGQFVYFMRPVVNVDYVLIGILAPWIGRALAVSLFAGTMALELFINLAPVYHFEIADAMRWIGDLYYVNASVWLPGLLLGLAVSLGVALAATFRLRLRESRMRVSAALLVFGVLASVTDIFNGTSFIQLPVRLSILNFNVAYSSGRRALISVKSLASAQTALVYQPLRPQDSAAGELLARARSDQRAPAEAPHQIALVVVESMSLFNDKALQAQLVREFHDPKLAERYDVSFRTVPFHGHTNDGELRELCGVRLESWGEQGFPKCLPEYLREQGYETTALHGFTSQFYNRDRWYPKLGFERMLFAQEMVSQGVTELCGSGFKGICDKSVAEILHRRLLGGARGKPQFVYWMTLNSHLPMGGVLPERSTFDCSENRITQDDPVICTHARLVHRVIRRMARIAMDPQLPPTEFVIVGDHMAPFILPERRQLFSAEQVPAIILKPIAIKKLAKTGAASPHS